MDEETKKAIEAKFDSLPRDVKEALESIEVGGKLANISEKHGLRPDGMLALETETLLIMLGLQHPRDYVKNLQREAGTDEEKARAIAKDVNTDIFRPIRESLKQIHKIHEEEVSSSTELTASSIQYPVYGIKREAGDDEKKAHRIPDTRLIEHAAFHEEAGGEVPENLPTEEDEVENPPNYGGETLLHKKLKSTFRMPSEKTEYERREEAKLPASAQDKKEDPYREPIG